jgi:hypothetical protein
MYENPRTGVRIRSERVYGFDRNPHHYWAVRQFGPIGYEIVAISDTLSAPGRTPACYQNPSPIPGPDA